MAGGVGGADSGHGGGSTHSAAARIRWRRGEAVLGGDPRATSVYSARSLPPLNLEDAGRSVSIPEMVPDAAAAFFPLPAS